MRLFLLTPAADCLCELFLLHAVDREGILLLCGTPLGNTVQTSPRAASPPQVCLGSGLLCCGASLVGSKWTDRHRWSSLKLRVCVHHVPAETVVFRDMGAYISLSVLSRVVDSKLTQHILAKILIQLARKT